MSPPPQPSGHLIAGAKSGKPRARAFPRKPSITHVTSPVFLFHKGFIRGVTKGVGMAVRIVGHDTR